MPALVLRAIIGDTRANGGGNHRYRATTGLPNHRQYGEPRDTGQPQGLPLVALPDVVHRFKTMTTKRYVDGVKQKEWPPFPGRLWQRNYSSTSSG